MEGVRLIAHFVLSTRLTPEMRYRMQDKQQRGKEKARAAAKAATEDAEFRAKAWKEARGTVHVSKGETTNAVWSRDARHGEGERVTTGTPSDLGAVP